LLGCHQNCRNPVITAQILQSSPSLTLTPWRAALWPNTDAINQNNHWRYLATEGQTGCHLATNANQKIKKLTAKDWARIVDAVAVCPAEKVPWKVSRALAPNIVTTSPL
jgi:hypothetical protein